VSSLASAIQTGNSTRSVRGPVWYQVCVPIVSAGSAQYTASGQRRRHANASAASTIAAITASSRWNSNACPAGNGCRNAAHQVVFSAWTGVTGCRPQPAWLALA
jgi:hypothetical protein